MVAIRSPLPELRWSTALSKLSRLWLLSPSSADKGPTAAWLSPTLPRANTPGPIDNDSAIRPALTAPLVPAQSRQASNRRSANRGRPVRLARSHSWDFRRHFSKGSAQLQQHRLAFSESCPSNTARRNRRGFVANKYPRIFVPAASCDHRLMKYPPE